MNKLLQIHQCSTRFDKSIEHWGGAVLSLGVRALVGWQFFKAGLVKVQDWPSTLSLFQDEYHVPFLSPELAAYMGAGGELVLPVFLLCGLFSRPAALGLFFVNLMAVIAYPQLWMFDCPAAINDHIYWGVLLLVIVAHGGGKFSLDRWLSNKI